MSAPTIIAIGDMHLPWSCHVTLKKIYKIVEDVQPDVVVQLGDLYDQFSWSKFPRTHNLMTPAEELSSARLMATDFWKQISRAAPNADRYQLWGNHDERIKKRVLEKMPEIESLVSFSGFFQFDGVTSMPEEREELTIAGIVFMHGFRQAGKHCEHNLANTVVGHLHRGYTHFYRHAENVYWELNAGMVADPTSVPLSYAKQRKYATYHQGVGLIDELGPRFIPL